MDAEISVNPTCQTGIEGTFVGFDHDRSAELPAPPDPRALNTAPPPGAMSQLFTLLHRQNVIMWRDKITLWLHLVLLVTFPGLVAIFDLNGPPQVRTMDLHLQTDVIKMFSDALSYAIDTGHAATLVSGLTMFQVILLALMGANNGAREIAKERDVLEKELRAGLSPWAYVTTKGFLVLALSIAQAFWMTWFVKTLCEFPGSFPAQFLAFFATCFLAILTLLFWNLAGHHHVNYADSYLYIAMPTGAAVLAVALVFFTGTWLRRKISS